MAAHGTRTRSPGPNRRGADLSSSLGCASDQWLARPAVSGDCASRMRKALLGAVVALGLAAIAWAFLGRSRESSGHFLLDVRTPSQGRAFSAALEQTVGAPLRPGHKLTLLPNGKIFDALTEAIRGAKQSIDIEMYIWSHGKASTQVVAALRERKKGVACRVLLDAEGSISRGEEVDKDLRDVKCAILLFRKSTAIFARNPSTEAVITARIAGTGG